MAVARAREERIEFRTTREVRDLVERALDASGRTMTEFAEASLTTEARRVLADRDRFVLASEEAAAWDAINARSARALPGLRRLMERPSPFAE
jgi:uncharacterized protein (DUF1778 family)